MNDVAPASAVPRFVSWSPSERTTVYPVSGYAVSHCSAVGTVDASHVRLTVAVSSAAPGSATAPARLPGAEGASGTSAEVDSDAGLEPWALLAVTEYE